MMKLTFCGQYARFVWITTLMMLLTLTKFSEYHSTKPTMTPIDDSKDNTILRETVLECTCSFG